nr:unnamed protein product [Digitaria exilis]
MYPEVAAAADAAAGLEWWRNAAEQSTVVTTAKKPSATASDIPATARSRASCAPWNTAPSATILPPSSFSLPFLPPVVLLWHAVGAPPARGCVLSRCSRDNTREDGRDAGMEEKRRVTRGAARGREGKRRRDHLDLRETRRETHARSPCPRRA